MTRRIRRTGGVAAIGALVAGMALLTALPAAMADELSDLRANNELLQQRLDQLAQVGTAKPMVPMGTASLAGSFPRSFLIPGTDTSIAIGGRVIFDATEWFHGGNPNIANSSNSSGYGNATISGLPLNGSAGSKRSNYVFYQNVQNSRLSFETRTPTGYGVARTYVEFDFADCSAGGGANANDCSNLTHNVNPLLPRLRLAYAQLGGFMLGQNWGIGLDLAAAPESFNSTGIVGMWGVGRVPEASYTWKFPGASLEVGLVMQDSTLGTPNGFQANDSAAAASAAALTGCTDCQAYQVNPLKNSWPAPAFALTFNQPWGHVQFHGAFHEIYLDDGLALNQSYLVGGGGVSGNFMTWGKDNIGFSAHAGAGDDTFSGDGSPGNFFPSLASNYASPGAGCYGAVATIQGVANPNKCGAVGGTPISASSALVKTQIPTNWGANVNFQHWWTPVLRSTLNFGYEQESLPTSLLGTIDTFNTEETLGSLNLIWSPVPFVDTGFEAFYGERKTLAHHTGTAEGLDYSFVMKF